MITIKNLHEQKLSDLMESLLFDIQRSLDCGFKIDMGSWVETNEDGKACTVCLGGAALCGFVPDLCNYDFEFGGKSSVINKLTDNGKERYNIDLMTSALNSFRVARFFAFFEQMKSFLLPLKGVSYTKLDHLGDEYLMKLRSEGRQYYFNGLLSDEQVEALISNIKIFVDFLRENHL